MPIVSRRVVPALASRAPAGAAAASTARFYRPELDALRFAAFLLVFLHHAFPRDPLVYASGAGVGPAMVWTGIVNACGCGLPLFFALSGYLITDLLVRERAAIGHVAVRRFYARRILRIWPLYAVGVALGVAVAALARWCGWYGWFGDGRMLAMYLTFTGNFYFADVARWPENPMTLLWSLSIEEQFYLVLPFLLIVLRGRGLALACLALVSLALARAAALGAEGAVPDTAIWTDSIVQFGMLATGSALSLLLAGRLPDWTATTRILLCVVAGLLWLEATLVLGIKNETAVSWGAGVALGYGCVALGCAALLLAALGSGVALVAVLVRLGRMSFGLYVYHALVFLGVEHAAAWAEGRLPSFWVLVPLKLAVGLPVTVAVAALSFRWLEAPFLRLKERLAVVPSAPLDGPG